MLHSKINTGKKLTLLLGLATAAVQVPASAQVLSGVATAVDGDSLAVGSQRVRLDGIDAPELDQDCIKGGESWQCGERSRQQLGELVAGQRVDCQVTGLDQYGRSLGICSTEYLVLNEAMVELGWALAYREYSQAYVEAEERAKARGTGVWASTFTPPWEHRRAITSAPGNQAGSSDPARRPGRSTPATGYVSPDCRIKGNRNRKGQWIYHLPGMPYYEKTRAEEFFCSESQAQAAGYRRAIVR